MAHARKFLRLPTRERWLLVKALVAVGSVRVGLWCLPFRALRPLFARLAPRTTGAAEAAGKQTADRVAWAVRAAARYVPSATCLTQALAAQVLLARRGETSQLHIGVGRDERRAVTAHAWLESRGRIVLGGESQDRYLPLTLLGERNSPERPAAQMTPGSEVA